MAVLRVRADEKEPLHTGVDYRYASVALTTDRLGRNPPPRRLQIRFPAAIQPSDRFLAVLRS